MLLRAQLLLTTFASATGLFAQQQSWEWVEPFVGGVTRDIATDASGNTYAVHRLIDTVDFGGVPWQSGQLGTLAKYDASGSIVWAQAMNLAFFDKLALKGDTLYAAGHAGYDTTFSIGGQTWSWNTTDGQALLLSAFTTAGAMVWTQLDTIVGGTDVYDIEINDANEILMAMKFNGRVMWYGDSLWSNSSIPTLVKRAPGGNRMWYAQPYIGSVNAKGAANGVAALPDGGAVITGYFVGDTCLFDTILLTRSAFFMARADANGNFMWARDGNGALGNDVDLSLDDSLFVAGTYFSDTTNAFEPLQPVTIGIDMFLAKFDVEGDIGWLHSSTALTTGTYNNMRGMCVDPDGDPLVVGYVREGAVFSGDTLRGLSLYLEKVHGTGGHMWTATMSLSDSTGYFEPWGIGADGSGHGYVSGTFRNGDLQYNGGTTIPTATSYTIFVARTEDPTTGLSSSSNPDSIVFPNPTSGALWIAGLKPSTALCVLDLSGRVILERRNAPGYLDIGSLSDGIYLLRWLDEKGVHLSRVVLRR